MRVAPDVQLAERSSEVVDADGVVSVEGSRLVVRGLKTCASVHSCPVCAATILRERADDLSLALNAMKRERVAFVTFTLRHTRRMSLGALRKLEALAYSELKAGRPGLEMKERLGYVGDVKAAEQTWGENGWHPHLHALWNFDRVVDAEQLKRELSHRWRTVLVNAHARLLDALEYFIAGTGKRAERERERCGCSKCSPTGEGSACLLYEFGTMGSDSQRNFAVRMFGRGYVGKKETLSAAALRFKRDLETLGTPDDFLPNYERGVWVELVEEGSDRAATYLAKMGLELAGIASKTTKKEGHYTSWDIAREAAEGRPEFVALWREHSAAMRGARQLTWSRGLRDALGLRPERSDRELLEDEQAPRDCERFIGSIAGPLWDARVRHDGQALFAELVEAYARGDARGHPLVTPGDAVRLVRAPEAEAPRLHAWEWWRITAEARARGREKLPRAPMQRTEQTTRSVLAYLDSLDNLREVLALEHGIGK